jgi:SAM-dependent methyltransferase
MILIFNTKVNGFLAFLYSFGLGNARFYVYTFILNTYSNSFKDGLVLDIGCGHSILPLLIKRFGFQVISLDTSKDALKWQAKRNVRAVLASAEKLPFKEGAFHAVTAISSLEHIHKDGDKKAMEEIGRVLKTGGIAIVDVPFVCGKKERIIKDHLYGIPTFMRFFPKRFFEVIFKKFRVDKGDVLRQYNFECVSKRLIAPSKCVLEEQIVFGSEEASIIYKIIPMATLAILEYLMAKRVKTFPEEGGIVLKLRKERLL